MKKIPQEDLLHILKHTEDIWEAFRDKSVFITGGTGFFGKWLLDSFIFINNKLGLNAALCVLSRDPETFLERHPFYKDQTAITFVKGDIQEVTFPEGPFHFIIHAATDADAKLNSEDPMLMLETITQGTKKILEFAVTQPIEGFLLTSSGAVYGKQPADVTHVKETDSFGIAFSNPAMAYAEGKRIAELYCSIYNKQFNLPVKIARCFAFVGPYLPLDKHFAIGNFILNAINEQDIQIKGDGTPYRSYLYAADLAIWLWTILIKGVDNQPYNVGSDEAYTIKEVAELISDTSAAISTQVLCKSAPGQPVERYVPSVDLAKNELSLKVEITLSGSIEKTIKFYDPSYAIS